MRFGSILVAFSAALLGLALQVNDGLYSQPAVALLALSLALCIAGVFGGRRIIAAGTLDFVLGLLVILQLLAFMARHPGAISDTPPGQTMLWVQIGAAVVALAALLCFVPRRKAFWAAFVLVLGAYISLSIWKIRVAPSPWMDVFTFQTDSAHALVHGIDPYRLTFPNPYEPDVHVYAPGVVQNGRLMFGFPYMPLVLAWTTPAQMLLGDFRYAFVLAMVLSAIGIVMLSPDRKGVLVATLLLFTPRGLYLIENGWTEPLSAMLLVATVLSLRRRPRHAVFPLGLFLASKQYLVAAVLLKPLRACGMLLATAIAAAVSLPLILWDLHAFLWSAIKLQFRQPYRPDALSFLAWWGDGRTGFVGPWWICFVAFVLAAAIAHLRKANFAGGFAFCFFVFFATNKQAFANYYLLVIAALCLEIVSTDLRAGGGMSDTEVIGPCDSSRSSS